MLDHCGIGAKLLPLCGSIPYAANADPEWLGMQLVALGVPAQRALSRTGCWRFGIFGALHPAWSPEPLFSYISEAATRAGRDVTVSWIGRSAPGDAVWRDLRGRYNDRFSFAALGERTASEVSVFLQSVDFGIALTPWQVIGKSATAAAMLDHGLPIIVSRDDFRLSVDAPPAKDPLLYRMDSQLPQWLVSTQRQLPHSRLPAVARGFMGDTELALQSIRREIDDGSVPIA
jgi:hypothetical protein